MDDQARRIKNLARTLIGMAATQLPDEVMTALCLARERESNPTAQQQLTTILQNIKVCQEEKVSICQDPGIPCFEVTIGSDFNLNVDCKRIFTEAVAEMTAELPLRQNITHPLTRENTGTNTGYGIPYIFYDYLYGTDYLEITVSFRGGGAAFRSGVYSTSPTLDRVEAIKKIVFDLVSMAGGIPCPPTTIGVGIGGNPHMALCLAFKALRRLPPGDPHPDPQFAALEGELKKALNESNIGTMGLGGDTTVLGVHIEGCGAHIAGLPVAIAFSCWPNRFATVRLYKDGHIECLTHKEVQSWSNT